MLSSKKIHNIIFYQLPVLVWMCVIFYFSSRPTIEVSVNNNINFAFYKTLHVINYAILTTLLIRSFKKKSTITINHLKRAIIIAILYGISDEFHQLFVPGRTSRFRDVIIDGVGVSLVCILAIYSKKIPFFNKLIS